MKISSSSTIPFLLVLSALAAPLLTHRSWAQDANAQSGESVYEYRQFGENGITAPKPTYHPDPEYTDRTRRKKISGSVVLSIVVTPEGTVRDAKVTTSLDKDLDQQALNTVSTWKFEPATKDGKPVAVRIAVETTFRIR